MPPFIIPRYLAAITIELPQRKQLGVLRLSRDARGAASNRGAAADPYRDGAVERTFGHCDTRTPHGDAYPGCSDVRAHSRFSSRGHGHTNPGHRGRKR
jgi:hypothetical protein